MYLKIGTNFYHQKYTINQTVNMYTDCDWYSLL